MVQNPVLFITFARPEYARRTWGAIKAAKPQTLYFYSNKGRKDKVGELERNEEIRSYVKEIDWKCDLHTWFRDECVDVYQSLYGAITWLFDNEEQGIILEEDCVASLAFFDFCDQLLPKYKDDYRIWMISGDNYFENIDFGPYDYFFSQDMQIYGWASWKSRWKQIDWEKGLSFDAIQKENVVKAIIRSKNNQTYYSQKLKRIRDFVEKTHCWDYTFNTYGVLNNALFIIPARNLVENIGIQGAHHGGKPKRGWSNVAVTYKGDKYKTDTCPTYISPNYKYDKMIFEVRYRKKYGTIYRIINKIKSIWK